jgi:hypothetical protein
MVFWECYFQYVADQPSTSDALSLLVWFTNAFSRHALIVGLCEERHLPKQKKKSMYISVYMKSWYSTSYESHLFYELTNSGLDWLWNAGWTRVFETRRLTVQFSVMVSIQFSSRILSSFSKFKATILFGELSVSCICWILVVVWVAGGFSWYTWTICW